ncbi:MAG: hypothetical protein EXX96DRAFT_299342 [Benjaminiella poitrasii]|nr:MAG: hypothetical protein EXX96DRAFT_299342 [Benjaminiella poitrasii]
MSVNLQEIISKIASQGNKPDISFLKDNPEAQAMLLLALLSNNNNNNNKNTVTQNNETPKSPSSTLDCSSDSSLSTEAVVTTNQDDLGLKRKINDSPKKVGRKPVTSDDEDSDDPKSKRKAQNRAAQRAFRERKENHIRLLEERVKELEEKNLGKNAQLLSENKQLKETIARLRDENSTLLNSAAVSSFNYPLSSAAIDSEERPQKIVRSNNAGTSPTANFDNLSSSGQSVSSKSLSNTPESQHLPSYTVGNQQLSIDDILGINNTSLPSDTLLDHSELLGLNDNKLNDYSAQLEDMLNQHRFAFATDPSQFDFFYPINSNNNTNTAESVITTTTGTTNTTSTLPSLVDIKQDGDEEINNITRVWDKLSEHPRFDEIDMDVLCDEMHKKAIVKDSLDHDKELEKLVNEHYPVDN